MMKLKGLFCIIFSCRILSVFVVRTFYVPDEYWQSLEVAHKSVFGYGYLTWEWRESAIRNGIYPSLFAVLYKILQFLGLDYRYALVILPRILQAFITSIGDVYTVKLSEKLYGKSSAWWTFICLLTSWFMFYCGSRTLINTFETALTAATLYYFPWKSSRKSKDSVCWFIALAAITFIIRPTSAILTAPLALLLFKITQSMKTLAINFIVIGLSTLLLCVICDYFFYDKLVFTVYNFAHFNVWSGLSDFYGVNPWHWYFSQGFPAVMATHLLPFAFSLNPKHCKSLSVVLVIWYITVLSFISHKEFRFLMPVLPLAFSTAGKYLAAIEHSKNIWNARNFFVLSVIVNVNLSVFFGLFWGRGPLEAIEQVAKRAENNPDIHSILFLTPCHSMPLYSHLHANLNARFLSCEPNLSNLANYVDEADLFYSNQSLFMERQFENSAPPQLIITYDSSQSHLQTFFKRNNYSLCETAANFGMKDKRKGQQIHIYCHIKTT